MKSTYIPLEYILLFKYIGVYIIIKNELLS